MKRNWPEYNQNLIKRGEIYLDEEVLKNTEKELRKMNKRKEGHPYQYPNSFIKILGIIKVKFRLPYRMTIGLVNSLARFLMSEKEIPDYTILFRRMNKLSPDLFETTGDLTSPLFISIDGSGLRADHGGSWIQKRFGKKKKRYLKIIFAIDIKSKKIIELSVTTDKTHENKRFRGIIRRASRKHKIDKTAADPGFDDFRNYELLHQKRIKPAIKPRNNSNPDSWSLTKNKRKIHRLKQVLLYQKYSYETWKKKTGYNYRTLSESGFSSFKANYGEGVYSKKFKYAKQEISWKAYAFNLSR
jgi:hypothetical protein